MHGVVMAIPHPWRELRGLPHIDLSWHDLPVEFGRTDGCSIEMDRRLSQVQRRCTLAHELTHIRRGHQTVQPPAVERSVRLETARRLLPLAILTGALAYTLDLDYAAWDCWVTRDVLEDRLDGLTDYERAAVMAATAHHRDAS